MASIDHATLVPSDLTFGSATLADLDADPAAKGAPTGGPRFSVLGEIGRGGIGSVVAAEDRDIGRRVAIKRMLAQHQRSEGAVLRFVQEVRTVGGLDHPNIVPIHDVGRDPEGGYFFVMKLLEGDTLESIVGRLRTGDPATHQQWTFARRTELFVQILQAMRFAHDAGIVHRDIKPANVMVGRHGEVHVVDWGLAKRIGPGTLPEGCDPAALADRVTVEQAEIPSMSSIPAGTSDAASASTTRAGALVGTPRYMAPEQARGELADARTDTWQLALLFYELLTLHHYLDGADSLQAVLEGVKSAPIPHPRSRRSPFQPPVPADLGWFVFHGLQRDPAKRYANAGEMLALLERRADGEVHVECPVTAQKWMLSKAGQLLDRHPFLMTSALVGMVLTTVAAVAVGFLGVATGAAVALFL